MEEDSIDKICLNEKGKPAEPFGDRTIGLVDPRKISEEDFLTSKELLFHGSQRPFDFNRDEDYSDTRHFPGSFTLGKGFYTVPDRQEAELYSMIRQGGRPRDVDGTYVTAVLPFRARMYDCRSRKDPSLNAPVPAEFAKRWYEFYKTCFNSKFPDKGKSLETMQEKLAYSVCADYFLWLTRFFRENPDSPVDLRVLLRGEYSEENVAGEFRQFMLKQGYDGLIYIEAGDSQEARNTPSYVFYNLEKIGTYRTWKEEL